MNILKELDEIEANKKEAIIQGREIAEYLGVEELPIEYEEFVNDSSRLELKPRARIVVRERATYNKAELLDCIAHEYRHAFQIYYSQMMDDNLARLWREDLADAVASENIAGNELRYMAQAIEVDARAFAQVWVEKKLGVVERVKAEWYQMLIDEYNVNTIIGHRCNAYGLLTYYPYTGLWNNWNNF